MSRSFVSVVSLVITCLLLAGCPTPEPYCALNPCDDGGRGYGTLFGTAAFEVKTCRAYARLLADGGPDFRSIAVTMASVDHPCQNPQGPLQGPGKALVLQGFGGQGKGTFTSTGSNIYLVGLNPDGGNPVEYERAPAGPSSFTIDWGGDPTKGVIGAVSLAFADGGTIQGTFAGPYCGAY